jgi:hypothetical protein
MNAELKKLQRQHNQIVNYYKERIRHLEQDVFWLMVLWVVTFIIAIWLIP